MREEYSFPGEENKAGGMTCGRKRIPLAKHKEASGALCAPECRPEKKNRGCTHPLASIKKQAARLARRNAGRR